MLGSQLGIGAYRALVEERRSGVMVSVSGQLELHSLEGDGEVWVRGGNLSGATASNTLSLAQRLRQPSQTTADQRALIGDMVWEPTDGQTLFDRLIENPSAPADIASSTRSTIAATSSVEAMSSKARSPIA